MILCTTEPIKIAIGPVRVEWVRGWKKPADHGGNASKGEFFHASSNPEEERATLRPGGRPRRASFRKPEDFR